MVAKGKKKVHLRRKKETDNMDEFVQSMSVVLVRMLTQAERAEKCIKEGQKDIALADIDALIIQIGSMIEAFSHQVKPQ